jgi:hypothetical protein
MKRRWRRKTVRSIDKPWEATIDAPPKPKKMYWFRFSENSFKPEMRAKAQEMYDKGAITDMERQSLLIEWSTDCSGRKFHFVCPKCGKPMRHCPDPSCAEDGVGHHLFEEDWEGCDEDIPYSTAHRVYFPWKAGSETMISEMYEAPMVDQIKAELNEAIQKVLEKYNTDELPGLEFHGELRGILQHKDHPETATGDPITAETEGRWGHKQETLSNEQVAYAIDKMQKWAQTCEEHDRGTRAVDISHSSLLCRLLIGKPLLEFPPPRAFSYPAYQMVEQEECQIHELWEREKDTIYSYGEEYPCEGPVVVIDQTAEYTWEDREKKIVLHVPTGLRWQYFEKTAYPVAVAKGKPEDHPYTGKFLRRLPMRYLLQKSFFMGAGSVNEPVKEFGTLKAVKDYIRYNAVDCEWSYTLYDNVLGKEIVWSDVAWKEKYGLTRHKGKYFNKEDYE